MLKILGMQLPVVLEQVIAVPKTSCPSRSSRTFLSEPQRAEQLVEVPTVLSYSLLQERNAQQIVDIPVPHHGGARSLQGFSPGHGSGQRSVEQNPGCGAPGGRHGLRQSSYWIVLAAGLMG